MREQQGRFIDLISHEYRTPLAVLQANLDILGRVTEGPRREESVLRMGVALLRRLADVFSKAQRGASWAGHHRLAADMGAVLEGHLDPPGRFRVTLQLPRAFGGAPA